LYDFKVDAIDYGDDEEEVVLQMKVPVTKKNKSNKKNTSNSKKASKPGATASLENEIGIPVSKVDMHICTFDTPDNCRYS